MKKGLLVAGTVLLLAYALWAAGLQRVHFSSAYNVGDASVYKTYGVIKLAVDTTGAVDTGTVKSDDFFVGDAKSLFGFARVEKITTGDLTTARTFGADTVRIKLRTTMRRGNATFTKTLDSSVIGGIGQKIYNLGQGLDTLLWNDVFFDVSFSDTTSDSANYGQDVYFHFDFNLGKR